MGEERLKDTLYLSMANSLTRAVGFLLPFILIGFAGEIVYGKFVFILNTLSTIVAVFSNGITNVVSRYLSHGSDKINEEVFDELVVKSLRLILAVLGLTFLFFTFGDAWFQEMKPLKGELFLGVLYVLFLLLGSFATGYQYVKQNYIKLSKAIFVSSGFLLILLFPAAKHFGLSGIVLAYTLFAFIQLKILLEGEVEFLWPNIKSCFQRFKKRQVKDQQIFIKFILPITLASIAVPVSIWYANHLVAKSFGFSDLGFINIALQMQVIMAFLPTIFNSMVIPKLSKSFLQNRIEFFGHLKRLFFKTLATAGLLFVIIFIFSKEILGLYSPSYEVHSLVLRVFLLSFMVSILLNVVGVLILSVASMWWGALLNVIWAIAFLISIHFYLPTHGLMGFAYAYLISYTIHLFSVLIYTFYFFKKNT